MSPKSEWTHVAESHTGNSHLAKPARDRWEKPYMVGVTKCGLTVETDWPSFIGPDDDYPRPAAICLRCNPRSRP